MMKKLLSATLCLLALNAHSQDELSIKADMKWLPNDSLVTVYDPYSGDSDTTTIKNHKIDLTIKMPKGGCAYIMVIGKDPATMEKYGMVHYFEPGKVVIKEGSKPGLQNSVITGSQFVYDWKYVSDNLSEVSPRFTKLAELEMVAQKATQVGDEDAVVEAQKKMTELMKKRTEDALAWVRKNPNSGVASYVIMAYLSQNNGNRDSLIRTLGEHAQKSRISQRILNPGKVDKFPVSMGAGAAADKLAAGTEAPAFTTLDVNGKQVSLADFKGKYVFIDFWASWCGPCKPQIPFLKAANEKFKDKNFVMIGISLDGDRAPWLKAVEKEKMDWLQLSSLKSWKEPAAEAYGVGAIPFNILIGPDGKILAKGLYNADIEKVLSEMIK